MVLYEQNSQVLGVSTTFFADVGEEGEAEDPVKKAENSVVEFAKAYGKNEFAKDLKFFWPPEPRPC